MIIPATTYDGLSYLMKQGKTHDGDPIGHIWLNGEYAANGLRGPVPFSSDVPQARHVANAYQQAGYLELPNSGVPYGYAIAKIWGQLLKRSCRNSDLSRTGIKRRCARAPPSPPTSWSPSWTSPSRTRRLPGRSPSTLPTLACRWLRQVRPLFVAPDAQRYVAPHQNGD